MLSLKDLALLQHTPMIRVSGTDARKCVQKYRGDYWHWLIGNHAGIPYNWHCQNCGEEGRTLWHFLYDFPILARAWLLTLGNHLHLATWKGYDCNVGLLLSFINATDWIWKFESANSAPFVFLITFTVLELSATKTATLLRKLSSFERPLMRLLRLFENSNPHLNAEFEFIELKFSSVVFGFFANFFWYFFALRAGDDRRPKQGQNLQVDLPRNSRSFDQNACRRRIIEPGARFGGKL